MGEQVRKQEAFFVRNSLFFLVIETLSDHVFLKVCEQTLLVIVRKGEWRQLVLLSLPIIILTMEPPLSINPLP